MRGPGAIACALALLLSSCTNNLLNNGGTANRQVASDSLGTGGQAGVSILSRVVKSAIDPGGSLDLIGDGSGALGQYCQSADGDNSDTQTGASTCECTYSYINADGTSETVSVPTSYRDSNMIRCRYADSPGIPSSVDYAKVKILLAQLGGAYSNELSVTMNGTGTSLDLSESTSYSRVQRYQCRDIVYIPYLFETASKGVVYDPIQSEDPRLSYPLNFYTTNMGRTLALYAGARVKNWNCPALPNDSSAGMDLTVYSLGADDGAAGSKVIYPPAGSLFDRSTFYLAKSPTGVFNVPVNAYIAPTIVTSTQSNLAPPIGYGARPVATSNGETCPDTSVVIPSGYQWVKVWLFRADLPARKYRTLSGLTNSIQAVGCNPGKWMKDGVAQATGPYPNCAGTGELGTTNTNLVGRVLFSPGDDPKMCVSLKATGAGCGGDGAGCSTQANGTQYPNYTAYGAGTDIWKPNGNSCTLADPLHICAGRAPYYAAPTLADLDGGAARFDFLFVVTPVNITTAVMKNSSSSANHPYIPYRFMSPGDCTAADPDNCDPARRIVYGLKLHDVGTPGDPSGNDPDRAGVFPVCALQPKSN